MGVPDARLAQVQRLLAEGKAAQACAACRRLVPAAPNDPRLLVLMAHALQLCGETVQALHYAERAALGDPTGTATLATLGRLQIAAGRPADAQATLARALDLHPGHGGLRAALAVACVAGRRFVAAERAAANSADPTPDLLLVRAGCLMELGRVEDAVALLRGAVASHPRFEPLASGLANALNFLPGAERTKVFDAHRRMGEALTRIVGRAPRASSSTPSRRLRIGLLSPDLRQHSVAYFIEAWLAFRDRASSEVTAIYTGPSPDPVTERLRRHADRWRTPGGAAGSPSDIAALVRSDEIDILIDLSGNTERNNLPVMALRPAPVQVTYCGYPNTTGLAQIDYRIVDGVTDPPGAEAFATETLWRLDPCFLCYTPPRNAPIPGPPPSARTGRVTFGSFNAVTKLNRAVIALWSRLLREIPGSRLLLKAVNFADEELRHDVIARFGAQGVEASRVEILPPTSGIADHLAQYSRVDIALDPIPYNGTTTTCEALWMGVPVVTIAGESHAGRVGASLLSCIGLAELAASNEEAFVRTAIGLTADRLAALR